VTARVLVERERGLGGGGPATGHDDVNRTVGHDDPACPTRSALSAVERRRPARGPSTAACGITASGSAILVAMSATAIVLADDHEMVRTGLRHVLDAHEDLTVVAEAGSLDEAVAAAARHRPAVLVLDLAMPGHGPGATLDALPDVARRVAPARVVILTMQDDPAFARRALRTGAIGYVLKEAAPTELVEAVRRAAAGRPFLSPGLGAQLAAEDGAPAGAGTGTGADPAAPPDGLTEREAEILRLIALGHTNAEVGRILHLSVRTVEARRAHVQQKTGRTGRPELVRYALERGLLDDVAGGGDDGDAANAARRTVPSRDGSI
jgi:two-component system response regulator NreC